MTSYTAKHSCRLVVDVTPNQLAAKHRVILRRGNLLTSKMTQRLVADMVQPHRIVKLGSQVVLNVLIGNLFHNLRHVIEAHVAVKILLFAQRRLGHRVKNTILVIVDEIKIFSHPNAMAFIDMVAVELCHRTVFVDRHFIKWYPSL